MGLATRAGKVITGIELCEKAVKSKKAKLVIITKETAKSTIDLFKSANVPVICVESKEKLGSFTGKERKMLMCTVRRQEVSLVLNITRNLDNDSFIVVGEAGEIFGQGFKKI